MVQRAKGMSLYAKDKLNHIYFDSGQGFVTGGVGRMPIVSRERPVQLSALMSVF